MPREVRRSAAWFSDGARRKAEARRSRRCVECTSTLPSGRSPYCGRRCQWKFRGRYFWDAARTFVMFRDRYTCQSCRRRRYARELDVDHIREIAAGGATFDYTNLQTICRPCHRAKTAQFNRARRSAPLPDARGNSPAADWWLEWFPS